MPMSIDEFFANLFSEYPINDAKQIVEVRAVLSCSEVTTIADDLGASVFFPQEIRSEIFFTQKFSFACTPNAATSQLKQLCDELQHAIETANAVITANPSACFTDYFIKVTLTIDNKTRPFIIPISFFDTIKIPDNIAPDNSKALTFLSKQFQQQYYNSLERLYKASSYEMLDLFKELRALNKELNFPLHRKKQWHDIRICYSTFCDQILGNGATPVNWPMFAYGMQQEELAIQPWQPNKALIERCKIS